MNKLTIPYANLDKPNLGEELMRSKEIRIDLSKRQADSLKLNWDKYYKYYESRLTSPGSIKTALLGFNWLIYQMILDLRYKKIHCLNGLYMNYAEYLEPVGFQNTSPINVSVYFRLKGLKGSDWSAPGKWGRIEVPDFHV